MIRVDVKTRYGTLCVYKTGGGPKNVVLLHGSGSDSALLSWREVMRCFGPEYTVYAPDLLGYGESDDYPGIAGEQFYQIHIDCILELAESLGLNVFGLAGLSMGGAIAIGFALAHPERVAYLVPVGSWGLSEKLPFHRFSWWYIHKTHLTEVQYRWCSKSKVLARWSIAYGLIGNKALISDEMIQEVMYSCAAGRAGKSMLDFQRSSAGKERAIPFYGERLRALSMPVAFVIGEHDPLVPVGDVRTAHKLVPGSLLFLIEGCKHWTVKEKPEQFCEIINTFAL